MSVLPVYLVFMVVCCLTIAEPAFEARSPKGYCVDWVFPNDNSYDFESTTVQGCMVRCLEKNPSLTSFYVRERDPEGRKECGCSRTTSGECTINSNPDFTTYRIVSGPSMQSPSYDIRDYRYWKFSFEFLITGDHTPRYGSNWWWTRDPIGSKDWAGPFFNYMNCFTTAPPDANTPNTWASSNAKVISAHYRYASDMDGTWTEETQITYTEAVIKAPWSSHGDGVTGGHAFELVPEGARVKLMKPEVQITIDNGDPASNALGTYIKFDKIERASWASGINVKLEAKKLLSDQWKDGFRLRDDSGNYADEDNCNWINGHQYKQNDGVPNLLHIVYEGGTCTDGLQNQDETGVDCGNSCPACAWSVSTTITANDSQNTNQVAVAACNAVQPKECSTTIGTDGVTITVTVMTTNTGDTADSILATVQADAGVKTANPRPVSTIITANDPQYTVALAAAACNVVTPKGCSTTIGSDGVTITLTVMTSDEGDNSGSILATVLADAGVKAANGPSMQSQIDALLDKINSLELALAGCAKTQDLTIYAKTEDIAEQCVE